MPPYFYFLTLMALRVFREARVDVAVLEVGLGGRWDATNVVPAPVVCAITALGYDHMEILGSTLTLIAGEKAGILKTGVPAITCPQPEEAAAVLRSQAQLLQARQPPAARLCADSWAVQVPLTEVPPLAEQTRAGKPCLLGLAGDHQRQNAALAVQLCRLWAARTLPMCATTVVNEQARDMQGSVCVYLTQHAAPVYR